jgi:acyl-coenzyme A thioesterase PaaI-like protein
MSRTPRVPPTAEQLQAYAEGFNKSESLKNFGTELSFPEGKKVLATVTVKPEQLGGMGRPNLVNGAVIAGVFDLVIGCSAALVDPTKATATMQLSMSFESPVEGKIITAESWIDRAGGSTLFSSAIIRDGAGVICARCQGVVKLTSIPWQTGASPAVN